MKKCYLFVYSSSLGTREVLKKFLNESEFILDWYYELPNCFFVLSNMSSKKISDLTRSYFKGRGTFIFSEIGDNADGHLDMKSWDFIGGIF